MKWILIHGFLDYTSSFFFKVLTFIFKTSAHFAAELRTGVFDDGNLKMTGVWRRRAINRKTPCGLYVEFIQVDKLVFCLLSTPITTKG